MSGVDPSSPPSPGLTQRVVSGGIWSAGGQLVVVAASLIATPFVIRMLGTERYGALVLIQVILGYLAVADLGMGDASARFAARAYARGDEAAERRITWTALLLSLGLTSVVLVALVLGADGLVALVAIGPHLRDEATAAVGLGAVLFLARALSGVARTQLLVRLRLAQLTVMNSGSAVVQVALTPVVLLVRPTLDAAVALMAAVAAATFVLNVAASQRVLPALRSPQFDRVMVRPLLRFGIPSVGVVILGIALQNSEKLWLAHFASVATLAYYSVAFTLARLAAIIPGALGQPLLPAFARVAEDPTALAALYSRAARAIVVSLVAIALVLVTVAEPFLAVWAGPEFSRESRLPLYVLAVGVVADGASYVPRVLFAALARPGRILRYQLLTIMPFVIGAAVLVVAYGAIGAALAWTLRVVIEAGLLHSAASRHFRHLGAEDDVRPLAIAALGAVLVATAVAMTASAWPGSLILGASSIAVAGLISHRYLIRNVELQWLLVLARSALSRRAGSRGA